MSWGITWVDIIVWAGATLSLRITTTLHRWSSTLREGEIVPVDYIWAFLVFHEHAWVLGSVLCWGVIPSLGPRAGAPWCVLCGWCLYQHRVVEYLAWTSLCCMLAGLPSPLLDCAVGVSAVVRQLNMIRIMRGWESRGARGWRDLTRLQHAILYDEVFGSWPYLICLFSITSRSHRCLLDQLLFFLGKRWFLDSCERGRCVLLLLSRCDLVAWTYLFDDQVRFSFRRQLRVTSSDINIACIDLYISSRSWSCWLTLACLNRLLASTNG